MRCSVCLFRKYQLYTFYTDGKISNESFGMAGLDKGSTPAVNSSKGENKLMSYFGRINYNYDSRYYITATMRADGSSKFARGNRWGYFPSGSLAWALRVNLSLPKCQLAVKR